MGYLVNEQAVAKDLDVLTGLQRSAFALLLADYVLAVIEPIDGERSRRMSRAIAIDYLYLPHIEPHLAAWWRQLLGLPVEAAKEERSSSVSAMFPEGSLAQRFAQFHMDAPSDGHDLTRLAMRALEPSVNSAILVVEIAGDLVASTSSGTGLLRTIDYALFELYEQLGRKDLLETSVATCLVLATEIDGSLDNALSMRSRARAAGLKSFGAGG